MVRPSTTGAEFDLFRRLNSFKIAPGSIPLEEMGRIEDLAAEMRTAGMALPFLKPGYCKIKRENKSQPKAQECFYLGPATNHPRDAVRVLTKHRTLLITRHVTWQCVSPSPPVPAQMHDSLSQEEGRSEADDESTSDGDGGGVMDEQDKKVWLA